MKITSTRLDKTRSVVVSLVLLWVVLVSSSACEQKVEPADLVLLNGKIITVDEKQPEAEAIAIRKDTIVAVGSRREIDRYIGKSTQSLDINGKFAMPGFIEGHGHLLYLGQSKMELELAKAENWDRIVFMVKESVRKAGPGEWILGSGWHQEKWNKVPSPQIEGYPLGEALDKVSPENPGAAHTCQRTCYIRKS